jgi:hypothetical protein
MENRGMVQEFPEPGSPEQGDVMGVLAFVGFATLIQSRRDGACDEVAGFLPLYRVEGPGLRGYQNACGSAAAIASRPLILLRTR